MKKSKFKKIIATIAMMLAMSFVLLIPSFAEEADVIPDEHPTVAYPVDGGNIYFDPDTGAVVDSDRTVENVVIPPSIYGIKVIAIGDEAFRNVEYNERSESYYGIGILKSITIPDTVKTIGEEAFEYCAFLKEVIIPDSVTSIGNRAFNYCTYLEEIIIPDSVTSIGIGAFARCNLLKNITLPSNIEIIPSGCFYYDYCLDEIVIPDGVKKINNGAFENAGLEKVEFNDSITYIGERAFYSCKSLGGIDIPDSVEYIGESAFQGCAYITEVTIPPKVKTINEYTFASCVRLETLNLHENIEEIGTAGFNYCIALKEITVPRSVVKMGTSVFAYCSSLESVKILAEINKLPKGTFSYCSALKKIDLPSGLETISTNAFLDCSSLENIVLPNSVTTLEPDSFKGCKKLTNLIIGPNIKKISRDMFTDCSSLKKFTLGENVSEFNYDLFTDMFEIADISVHPNNEYFCVEDGVLFNKEKSILYLYKANKTNILYTVPESVRYIYDKAFYNCTLLIDIKLPSNLLGIGERAFSRVYLEYIELPESLQYIDEYAFYSCVNLKCITVPGSVKTIGNMAFAACPQLRSVILNEGVETIETYAFSDTDLWVVLIPESLKTVKSNGLKLPEHQVDLALTHSVYYAGDEESFNRFIKENGISLNDNVLVSYHNDTIPDCSPQHNLMSYPLNFSTGMGTYVNMCSVCQNEILSDEMGCRHSWEYWVTVISPTENEVGYKKRTCYKCGYTQYQQRPALGGDLTKDFFDVSPDSWYYDAVQYCYFKRYMVGTSDTMFFPSAVVNRQTFFTILAQVDGRYIEDYSEMSFADVEPGKWYSNSIEWAYRNGYTAGIGTDENGNPICGRKGELTREQIATVLFAFSGQKDKYTASVSRFDSYTDKDEISSWALDAIGWALDHGLISGTSETTLSPRSNATRAQIAVIIMNFLENK